jgi:CRISPR-associated endonuclease/helicase Cas3
LKTVAEKSQNTVLQIGKYTNLEWEETISRVAYIMGATHDIGKSSEFFQRYIKGDKSQNPILKSHSPISSLFCYWVINNDSTIPKENKFLGIPAALGVNGHHGFLKSPVTYSNGMYNLFEEKILQQQIDSIKNNSEVEKICEHLGIGSFIEFASNWQAHFNSMRVNLWKFEPPEGSADYFLYYMSNLFFSILLDSDRTDAAKIIYERTNFDENSVRNFISQFKKNPMELDQIRNKLFEHLDETSQTISLDQKILSITAQTGLGKTLSSLNFATQLRKRIKKTHGFNPRIIYVAPFTSILDQNFSVFEKVLNTQGQSDVLLLHHHLAPLNFSSFREESEAESYSTSQSELLITGWSSEIIATTFIQLFNTIFGKSTYDLRRFQNMAGSIIILDEIQSIPFEYWDAVRRALLFLSENYSIWFVLMTATQPLIFKNQEIVEIVGANIVQLPPRVTFDIQTEKRKNITEFCREVKSLIDSNPQKSILVELNTIKSASDTFNLIKNDETFFLSSQIIPLHRLPRIRELKNRLDSKIRTILVTTQVVEAGMDLDFDLAIRDIGPIDSIVQTAGRCNRNGLKKKEDSIFSIYAIKDENNLLYSNSVYGLVSVDTALKLLQKVSSVEVLVEKYFQEISRIKSNTKSLNIDLAIKGLDYDKVKENFNLIDEHGKVSVFVEYDEKSSSIWKRFLALDNAERKSRTEILSIRREIANYMINISESDKNKKQLEEISGIYKIDREKLEGNYDKDLGFIRNS